MKKLIILFPLFIFSTISYSQISKAIYCVDYVEAYDTETEELLGTNDKTRESYIVDFENDELTHITSKATQVYDIISRFTTGDENEFKNIIVKSRTTHKTYHFMFLEVITSEGWKEQIIARVFDGAMSFYYGGVTVVYSAE